MLKEIVNTLQSIEATLKRIEKNTSDSAFVPEDSSGTKHRRDEEANQKCFL